MPRKFSKCLLGIPNSLGTRIILEWAASCQRCDASCNLIEPVGNVDSSRRRARARPAEDPQDLSIDRRGTRRDALVERVKAEDRRIHGLPLNPRACLAWSDHGVVPGVITIGTVAISGRAITRRGTRKRVTNIKRCQSSRSRFNGLMNGVSAS